MTVRRRTTDIDWAFNRRPGGGVRRCLSRGRCSASTNCEPVPGARLAAGTPTPSPSSRRSRRPRPTPARRSRCRSRVLPLRRKDTRRRFRPEPAAPAATCHGRSMPTQAAHGHPAMLTLRCPGRRAIAYRARRRRRFRLRPPARRPGARTPPAAPPLTDPANTADAVLADAARASDVIVSSLPISGFMSSTRRRRGGREEGHRKGHGGQGARACWKGQGRRWWQCLLARSPTLADHERAVGRGTSAAATPPPCGCRCRSSVGRSSSTSSATTPSACVPTRTRRSDPLALHPVRQPLPHAGQLF